MSKSRGIANSRFNKWLKWIEEINSDTQEMLFNKLIFQRYLEIVKGNKDIQRPSDFHEWTIRNYGAYIVMAIRRQLDTDNDVISVRRLLKEIRLNPELITKTWFRTLYSSLSKKFPLSPDAIADSDFEDHAGKLDYFDPAIAIADLNKLDILGKKITRYANKRIAHKTKIRASLSFKEINSFLKEFEDIVKKYILIFTGSGYSSLVPVPQYDWEEIFTKTWIK